MAATIEIENDTGSPITSANFGAVDGGSSQQLKFQAKNVGDQDATSVQLSIVRLASNDGLDFAQLAVDIGGNPGTFSNAPINVGSMVVGAIFVFWGKVNVPVGETPAGNPRQFDVIATFTGT